MKKIVIARARLVPVPNRASNFRIIEISEERRYASDFLNESEIILSLLDNLTYAITIYTKSKNATEESL